MIKSTRLKLIFSCFLLLNLVEHLFAVDSIKEKHISAIVSAKWTETPLILETSEFLYRNNPESFWKFALDISSESNQFASINSYNNETYFSAMIQKASAYVSPMQFDLLKLSLSIRTYSPNIEMTRKLAEDALKISNQNCQTFVDINGKISCDVNKIDDLVNSANLEKKPFTYQYDKFYDFKTTLSQKSDLFVVLYAQIGTAEFKQFHDKIIQTASNKPGNGINYILRHNYLPSGIDSDKVALSGYGVELDIKSTEYKAGDDTKVNAQESDNIKKSSNDDDEIQGFLFNKLKQSNPLLDEKIEEYRKHLIESTQELAPLKAWQMQDLSLQAAQRIIDSEPSEALSLLEDLSQNYPIRARTLSKIQVRKDLKKALKKQSQTFESLLNLEVGSGALYLNGLDLNIETTDIFSLNSALKKEAKLIESLSQIGLSLDQVKDLIYLDISSKATDYGVDLRDSSIQWLNNLEKDKKYSYWSKSVQDVLRPTYPGMIRPIARNFFNLVFVLDPAKDASKSLISTAESFYVNDIPLRIGFVFVTNDEKETDGNVYASVALFRAHNYIKEKSTRTKALSFITDVYAKTPKGSDVSADLVIKEFKKKYPKENNLDDVFGPESLYDEGRKLTMDYFNKIGIKSMPKVFINGFPFSESEIEQDAFEESVLTKIMHLTSEIQMSVYKGAINDNTDMMDWLMSKDVIMPRLNPRILAPERDYLNINEFKEKDKKFIDRLNYLADENSDLHLLTLWLVCDPDSERGRKFIYDAMDYHESSKIKTKLAILMQKSEQFDFIKKIIDYSLNNLSQKSAYKLIKNVLKEKNFNGLRTGNITLKEIKIKDLELDDEFVKKVMAHDVTKKVEETSEFLIESTPFKEPNGIGILANGWILGPFDENESFIDSDFNLLESFVKKIGLKQIEDLINKWGSRGDDFDEKIFKMYSIIGKYGSTEKRTQMPKFSNGFVNVKPRKENEPFYDIALIIDPLTRNAQKVSTILKALSKVANVNFMIYFNCKEKLSAPPLKSFFRYVLESEIKFSDGKIAKPFAYFHNMPQSPILTMNIHSPESWMVEAVHSPYDLDNICLKEIDSDGAYGEFELEYLIIEGHAFDILSGQSPRGLQFILGTETKPDMYDTIVMANLGYFQLKASPGIWMLQLREGRSKDIYEIVSHENTDSETKRTPVIKIAIDSFEARVIKVKVSKKADKTSENLLDEKEQEKEHSIWDSINNLVGSSVEETKEEKENVLNIFSVASGHMYERLMRIMMLTVLKNTKARVKFWFLKNYLSPQFTEFLPYYAKEYNFDYELVQYKWPRWLHRESEKQRTIWGYKILFLDVLFPLNVEKIIYVDADQIVRADLTELRDLDLKGAPYGYTPFCDSRKEMDGYRFWKSGYWQMHLGHRKYHISALYVVDLKKFRKIAAGDRLRGQYQGLSQDPNSLSNLDQDLPNNMIHQVSIFSLPQEWLYCDTWCSPDTLSKAKTIDLCNNPMTKEPKLAAAVRIVPEWKDFDSEIKNLILKWKTGESDSKKIVKEEQNSNSKQKEDL